MAGVLFQVVHTKYWRGVPHKWSTRYQYNGTITDVPGAIALVKAQDEKMCFATGTAANGGIASVACYPSTGGVPLAETVYFDADTPASWIAYSNVGSGWSSVAGLVIDPVAETALLAEWKAGLSSSGKPVTFRKWYHSVPSATASGATQQVAAANVTTLQVVAQGFINLLSAHGLVYGTPAGRLSGDASIQVMYSNHQMPRGRRRKPLVSSSGKVSFPSSLLVVPGSDGSLG